MRNSRRSGLTLIEIVLTIALVGLLSGLSLWALKPGKSKLSSLALATALGEEFEATRKLAIAQGRPTALCIPTDGGGTPLATSVYRLEGWNKPVVTTSKGYGGDYPDLYFLAARWEGPAFTEGLPGSPLSKFELFSLDRWLPDSFKNDYVFCFTPDGGVVSNGQPAWDGRYTIVVAANPVVGGSAPNLRTLLGGDGAATLLLSPTGGIEVLAGVPSGTLGTGSVGAVVSSAPQGRTEYGGGGATVKLSKIRILPNPATAPPNQGVCVPGQVVTLEVYADDPEGRALFSKWTQVAETTPGINGQFTYPHSSSNANLVGEVDKMEFVYKVPSGVEWLSGAPPEGVGVFRARWNWTVPISSKEGDRYRVQADVRDVKGEVFIENPPAETFVTPPVGRLLVERRGPDGLWQLVMMNPDGSGERVLSQPGVEEGMPSLDRGSTKMAFLQGTSPARYVKVRPLNGGPEWTAAGPGTYNSVSLSPDGAWVSYRNDATQELITRRVGGAGAPIVVSQPFSAGGHGVKKSRTGWSQNSRYMLYEKNGLLFSQGLYGGGEHQLISGPFWNTQSGYDGPENPYAPTTYQTETGERLLLSLGSNNPVLISFPITEALLSGGQQFDPGNLALDYSVAPTGGRLRVGYGGNGPSGADNDYPSVSSDGMFLIFTRSPQTSGDSHSAVPEDTEDQVLMIVPRSGDNFVAGPGGPTEMPMTDVRRAIWIPEAE